jgi:hypothetical protein
MALAEPCPECGIVDALGRHDGTCPRAIEMGLPRLADGEEPIDPLVDEEEQRQVAEGRIYQEQEAQMPPQAGPPLSSKNILWMAFHVDPDDVTFDAVVFDSELEALRYAVAAHWQVMQVQLGHSLLEQARGGLPSRT